MRQWEFYHHISSFSLKKEVLSKSLKSVKQKKVIPLPILPNKNMHDLYHLLWNRRSTRKYSKNEVSIKELSILLNYSFMDTYTEKYVGRTYPSAGALQSLNYYIIVLNSKRLQKGIYIYESSNREIKLLKKGDASNDLVKISGKQKWAKNTPIYIVITGDFSKIVAKYGERGYRHVLLEAGHAAQNVYLVSESLHLGCCAIGGFYDNALDKLLDLKRTRKSIYILTIGHV